MRRVILVGVSLVVAGIGGFVAWRASRPPDPAAPKSLDERPYAETTDKEREDWMRKLGYVD